MLQTPKIPPAIPGLTVAREEPVESSLQTYERKLSSGSYYVIAGYTVTCLSLL